MAARSFLLFFVLVIIVCRVGYAMGGTNIVEQNEMVVVAKPLYSAVQAGQDSAVATVLRATPGIVANSQGVPGSQADISIRGSSFSGAGISLNGLSMNSPQTEHFNAELPLPAGMLTAPLVLSGIDQELLTDGHLVGTAAFDLLPINTGRSLTLGVSQDNGYWVDALVQQSFGLGKLIGGIGGFAGHTEINSVDYDDNDLSSSRGGGHFQIGGDESQFDFVAGVREKEFGARGYYGVNPDWYAEESLDDELLLASYRTGDPDDAYLRISGARRELRDDYTIYWDFPGVYNNSHRSVIYSASVAGRNLLQHGIELNWRGSAENERIRSASLGNHSRASGSGLLLPGVTLGQWKVLAGARYDIFEDAAEELLPQGAVEREITKKLRLRLAHSQSMRQPSYTELNYESPASLGNSGLENQKSKTTELRVLGKVNESAGWHAALFRRRTDNTVDWIRATADAKRWTAENLGRADTDGIEAGIDIKNSSGSRLNLLYSFLHKQSDADFYASRYAFDYPEHYLLINGLWQATRLVGIELMQTVRLQADNAMRNSSDTGLYAMLALHLDFRKYSRVHLNLMLDNLWNDDYEYFPGQATVSPRRFSAGITLDW